MPSRLFQHVPSLHITLSAMMLLATPWASAAELEVPRLPAEATAGEPDAKFIARTVQGWAGELLNDAELELHDKDRLGLQLITAAHADAMKTLQRLQTGGHAGNAWTHWPYALYLEAQVAASAREITFDTAFMEVFTGALSEVADEQLLEATWFTTYDLELGRSSLSQRMADLMEEAQLSNAQALAFIRQYQRFMLYEAILSSAGPVIENEYAKRYVIDGNVLVKTRDGASVSVLVAKKKNEQASQPAALLFTIYADAETHLRQAIHAANQGYVGVVANTRGKRLSRDEIVPYEHEHKDVNAVIEWISKQSWSDGRVGMYGGSYSGFAQWAAAKTLHPALKTIVPYVAAIPGQGLPMENNIFLNANYGWVFYVTGNRTLDKAVYSDRQRWDDLNQNWYQSGKPYRQIDQVDGRSNPLLQRWLQHPAYDEYWQRMVPYKDEYGNIDIPVLSVTGYYDDGQISAIHYLNEHYKYNKDANHYLIIGPYDHWGAQSRPASELRGYAIDPVADINVTEITFQWFDHVLKDGAKPELLKDRINYQVMGSNQWRHESSLNAMNERHQQFYLSKTSSGDFHRLTPVPDSKAEYLTQTVDMADRTTTNNDYYPWPIIKDAPTPADGLIFVTEPLQQDMTISGQFSGQLQARINKKDMDIGVVLYEWMPDGKVFHLSYFLGRASYAHDMRHRRLLVPDAIESIPFDRTRMVSKLLKRGSRLLVVLNVNKNPHAQINYGSGKDVSDESISDAGEPLEIHWFNSSYINIPISDVETKN